MAVIDRVKTITGLYSDSDTLLTELIAVTSEAVNAYCGTESVPTLLEFIIVEIVVARYNRLGAEGFRSEQVDVVRQEFASDLLQPYKVYMNDYKIANSSVRFV